MDAALAIYTDFHWADPSKGIAELVRVARDRVVLLTVDRAAARRYWLTRDYFPGGDDLFRDLECVTSELPGACDVTVVPIPHDCLDGFVHAFWRRPREFLDSGVRSSMALFDRLSQATLDAGLSRLRFRPRDWRLGVEQPRIVRLGGTGPRTPAGRLAPRGDSADLGVDDRAVGHATRAAIVVRRDRAG